MMMVDTLKQITRTAMAGLFLLAVGSQGATAKIDLVTLPARGDVELTIYNPANLTLVRERRTATFTEGENPLQFSWANTLIDPTSVYLEIVEGGHFLAIDDIAYPADAMNTLIWTLSATETGTATIEISYFTSGIRWEADYVVRAEQDERTAGLESFVRVTNNSGEDYLEARTRLLVGAPNVVEDIGELARSAEEDFMRLNRSRLSGRDLDDADSSLGLLSSTRQTQVATDKLTGTLTLDSADFFAIEESEMDFRDAKKEVTKASVSEYYLFSIEGREDLEDGLSKRLQSFASEGVTTKPLYRHDPQRYYQPIVKMLVVDNNEESGLGEAPLPEGRYDVFAQGDEARGLAWLGRHNDEYVPVGDDVELNLGDDGRIVFERRRTAYRIVRFTHNDQGDIHGWDVEEDWVVSATNTRTDDVEIEVFQHFSGDFDFASHTAQTLDPNDPGWTKEDDDSWKLAAELSGGAKRDFAYSTVTRHGANAKK